MPYKSEKIKIANTKYDRRIKLTDEDKEEIKELHKNGMSQRKIAKQFKVDRSTIRYILFPEKLIANKKKREERGGWKQYYDKDKHKKSIADTRKYKQKLKIDGKI